MSRPSVGSSSTSNFASMAMTRARCSWATMPFDNCLTLLVRLMVVLARKPSAFARSNRGCTPATYSSICETRIQRGSTATSAMKETSRMSCSREFQGSRPSTFSSPSYEVRPRIALSAVVLPAPLGPMIPRMRPSSTRKSTLSSAIVVPKALRRRRASMQAMASALLLCSLRRRPVSCGGTQQFLRCDAEPLNSCGNPGPLFGKKLLAFALQQQIARAGFDEHAETSFRLDKLFVNQLLIGFENRQRIDPIFGRNTAHGRQRIAFAEHAVEYHVDDTIAKLAINRLTIVPFTRHSRFQIDHFLSYSDIVNYNTIPQASLFLIFFARCSRRHLHWDREPAGTVAANRPLHGMGVQAYPPHLEAMRIRNCVAKAHCARVSRRRFE